MSKATGEVVSGIVPRSRSALPGRMDAHDALAWIAWRTADWKPHLEVSLPERAAIEAQLEIAMMDLIGALANGKITATASKPVARGVPGCVGIRIQPLGVSETIPAAVFDTPGLRIERFGYVLLRYRDSPIAGETELPLYLSIRFATADLMALWPDQIEQTDIRKSDPYLPVRTRQITPPKDHLRYTAAVEWMQKNVTGPRSWKSNAAFDKCKEVTKAPIRVCKAAWKSLPDDFRGKPGRRK